MTPLEFWFEFASTYSYPAAMRVERRCQEAGVTLIWRPFLLGPVFKSLGMADSPFNLNPVKGRYMWRDMARVCAAQGLAFRRPGNFPRGSLLAARIAVAQAGAPWIGPFIRNVYTANFAEDRAIGEAQVIADILTGLDLDPRPLLDMAQAPATKEALRAQTDAAIRQGVFGAPSMRVAGDLFWGNDRLDAAIEAARTA